MRHTYQSFVLILCSCFLGSCQPIRQYPAVVPVQKGATEAFNEEVAFNLSWSKPRSDLPRDLPIEFIHSSRGDEWNDLKTFWNLFPPPVAGMRTVHIGLPPLEAVSALVMTEYHERIKIKVPLGLPDPTPHIPATNPPTYRRWQLGRRLFFERSLPGDYSCALCHQPGQGFTENLQHSPGGSINTLSLINVVYNRRQFWDGRVRTLEETVVRSLDDEQRSNTPEKALTHHRWGGFVQALGKQEHYTRAFQSTFGVSQPTQDTVARALATYMRTILAGDSLFDRAEKRRLDTKADKLTAEHFVGFLDEKTTDLLLEDDETENRQGKPITEQRKREMSVLLAKGYDLFQSKGRCSQCHSGALFTDQDYHNVGYSDPEGAPSSVGRETGRSVHVPIGQKEERFLGAYRTPTLRNLRRTKPYFHDGSLTTLPAVVDYYNAGIVYSPYLATSLRDGDRPARLNLSKEETDALVLFLRSLEGTFVDPIITTPPLR